MNVSLDIVAGHMQLWKGGVSSDRLSPAARDAFCLINSANVY